MTRLVPASFEVERFEQADACLEVRGRWFGVRGRRFMRPALTTVSGGREHRMLAVLDHKPWIAEDGQTWLAAFPCSSDPAALDQVELTVAPDVTVALPPPSPLGAGRRQRRVASRRSPSGPAPTTAEAGGSARVATDMGTRDSQLRLEHDAALRSRDEALAELETVQRDCGRLRAERRRALAAREATIVERREVIEAEVERRITDLRAEVQRERAGASLAAGSARERDQARAARDEAAHERDQAARERDEAREERDDAQRERNRMLAERDTARSRVQETTRQWVMTAALGTRRTLERDAVAVERDRLARDRDAALEARNRVAHERDAAPEPRRAVEEPTLVLPEREITLPDGGAGSADWPAPLVAPGQPVGSRGKTVAAEARAPGARSGGDATEVWRKRLVAVSALLVALVVLTVLLLAK